MKKLIAALSGSETVASVIILLLPFLLFYWMLPFWGKLTIGNDYVHFPIEQQMELHYSLEHGAFPLYVPGFAGGRSSAALTLGQVYHPLSWLSRLMPGYWQGNALEWNTFWRLTSLGLTQLLIFILLRKLALAREMAFILSFITVYNLRMLDMFRYGASLENLTGYLCFCAISGVYYLKPTRFLGPVGMIAAAYGMICGGHPQIMYLSLIGAVFASLTLPFVLENSGDEHASARASRRRYWTVSTLCIVAALLLSSMYTLPFYLEFVRDNTDRVKQGYQWSLTYTDTWGGAFNNFFQPLRSEVTGAFGSTPIILMALLAPFLALFRGRIPAGIWVVWAALVITFTSSLGDATPIHYLAWKYLPFADSFRVPGRYNILLLWPILLLTTWMVLHVRTASMPGGNRSVLHPVTALAVLSMVLFLAYTLFIMDRIPGPPYYFPKNITGYPHWIDFLIVGLGFLSLLLLSAWLHWKNLRGVLGLLLVCTVVAQVQTELRYGTWVETKKPTPSLAELNRFKTNYLAFYGAPGYGMASPSVRTQMERSMLDPFLARHYRSYRMVPDQEQAYQWLATERRANEAVIEKQGARAAAGSLPNISDPKIPDSITLQKSTFNEVVFLTKSTSEGLFCLAFPYSTRWRASIDGKQVPTYRANGNEIGIQVEPGEHELKFRYWSWPTLTGLLLACGFLALGGTLYAFTLLDKKKRFVALIVSIGVPAFVFLKWYGSIYDGRTLGTRYFWTTNSFPPVENIAYAKRTRMSSIQNDQMPYFYAASLAVDGNRGGLNFSTSASDPSPWWEVDLGSVQELDHMLIFPGRGLNKQLSSLMLQGSVDGVTYRGLATIQQPAAIPDPSWKILLNGERMRFLRMTATGQGPFSLAEVELYPR